MNKLKIFGTCAGAILLANHIISDQFAHSLKLIDVTIERNAYGSQIHSFEKTILIKPYQKYITGVFIRAPRIIAYNDESCSLLAMHQSSPVLIQNNNILLSTFHPEYTVPPIIHDYFLNMK